MRYVIVGTAGHIDHGKSSLVKALTGVEMDNLPEERRRGMSIELGFVTFVLPSGNLAGIIDVPGHERFTKNMLAGAHGVDLVLLVIDANEGIMPQTREHLEIMELLNCKKGIIVLTKIDLADQDLIEIVKEDIKDMMKNTFLNDAPLVLVSSKTMEGMDTLIKIIDQSTLEVETKDASGPFRLPIDRVFNVEGFGVVITGTLISGTINKGDLIEILPSKKSAEIRNIQVQNKAVVKAYAGQRVAINLSRIKKSDLNRGDVIASLGLVKPTLLLDVKLKILAGYGKPVKNRDRVAFYVGTSETFARIILLDRENLLPQEEGIAQLLLENTVSALKDDRFIIRNFSTLMTIGGGIILDPAPKRHRRFEQESIEYLTVIEQGSPEDIILKELKESKEQFVKFNYLTQKLKLSVEQAIDYLRGLISREQVHEFKVGAESFFIATVNLDKLKNLVVTFLTEYHQNNSLSWGSSKEELRQRINLDKKNYNQLLQFWIDQGLIVVEGNIVRLSGYNLILNEKQQEVLLKIENFYQSRKFQPEGFMEYSAQLEISDKELKSLCKLLLDQGVLISVRQEFIFHGEAVSQARKILEDYLAINKEITLNAYRDVLGTTRKFVQPLLRYFEDCGIVNSISARIYVLNNCLAQEVLNK
jgi:selenocysteine-specific elongation factor